MATATTTTTKAPYWRFTRIERLEDLIGRSREQEEYLLRAHCDARGAEDRAELAARIDATHRRTLALCQAARKARRTARATTDAV